MPSLRLQISTALAVVGVAAVQSNGLDPLCVMPEYDGTGRACDVDEDCCAGNPCVEGKCKSSDWDSSAVEAAYLAHLAVADIVSEVLMVSDNLHAASEGVAAASGKLKELAEAEKAKLMAGAKAIEENAAGQANATASEMKTPLPEVSDSVKSAYDSAKGAAYNVKSKFESNPESAADKATSTYYKAKSDVEALSETSKEDAQKAVDSAKDAIQDAKADAAAQVNSTKEAAHDAYDSVAAKVQHAKKDATDAAADVAGAAKEKFDELKTKATAGMEQAKTSDKAKAVQTKFEELKKNVTAKADKHRSINAKAAMGADSYSSYHAKFVPKGDSKSAGAPYDYSKFTKSAGAKGASSYDVSKLVNSAGVAGSFDYSQYTGMGTGGSSGAKASHKKKASGVAPVGGFDWSKYMGAGAGAGAGAHGKKSASAGGPFDYSKYMGAVGGGGGGVAGTGKAGATNPSDMGGFDYSKFVPGTVTPAADEAHGKSKGKGKDEGAATGVAGSAVDYQKFVPAGTTSGTPGLKGTNMASKAPSGFSYDQYMGKLKGTGGYTDPSASGSSSYDWSKTVPKMPAVSNAADYSGQQGMTMGDAQKPGTEGAPCGVTPYKDFGKCSKSLTCVNNMMYSAMAPGKCSKKSHSNSNTINNAVQTPEAAMAMALPRPGGLNGPCGNWTLGNMHFGPCHHDLECTEQTDVMLTFFGKELRFPNLCKESETEAAESSDYTTAPTSLEVASTLTPTTTDQDDSVELVNNMVEKNSSNIHANAAPAAVKAAAGHVADAANTAALEAADAAEVLAAKLIAAAAKVREAAGQLKKEATTKPESLASEPVAMLGGSQTQITGSHTFLTLVSLAAVAGAVFVYRSRDSHAYRRVQ